jgi:hypothetical protein
LVGFLFLDQKYYSSCLIIFHLIVAQHKFPSKGQGYFFNLKKLGGIQYLLYIKYSILSSHVLGTKKDILTVKQNSI